MINVSVANENKWFDVVGIGLGPANLALACNIDDYNSEAVSKIYACFLENQPSFSWHKDMLLPGAKLQVPFFRDLATLRSPQSKFTFLNYLHVNDRLDAFINLREFYPLRSEFFYYLSWACEQLENPVQFDSCVTDITPIYQQGRVEYLKIEYSNSRKVVTEIITKNIVLATGKTPYIPIAIKSSKIMHSSQLLKSLSALNIDCNSKSNFVVVGAGQSAGEIVLYLYNTFPNSVIHWCFSNYNLRGVDSNPFTNREYHQSSVEKFFTLDHCAKENILHSLSNSNYAVLDETLLKDIYANLYQEQFLKQQRLFLMSGLRLSSVEEHKNKLQVHFNNQFKSSSETIEADALVLATGYKDPYPHPLLAKCEDFLKKDKLNRYKADQNYAIESSEDQVNIYINGYCEHSHGPSDPTLSTIANKAKLILNAILSYENSKT